MDLGWQNSIFCDMPAHYGHLWHILAFKGLVICSFESLFLAVMDPNSFDFAQTNYSNKQNVVNRKKKHVLLICKHTKRKRRLAPKISRLDI